MATCSACHRARPRTRPEPEIECGVCGTLTPVPFTNATKNFRATGQSLLSFSTVTGAKIKDEFHHLKSKPATFNCKTCNNRLQVPEGIWTCQTCTFANQQDEEKCSVCFQKKSEQRLLCGVCRRSTQVPATNIENTLASGWRELTKTTSQIYYNVMKSPYVTCPHCTAHTPIPDLPASRERKLSRSCFSISSASASASASSPSAPSASASSASSASSPTSATSAASAASATSTSSTSASSSASSSPTSPTSTVPLTSARSSDLALDEDQEPGMPTSASALSIPCSACGLKLNYAAR